MTVTLLQGDCRDILPTLPADSVHCVVCSPPYYGLRDYQTGTWHGGDPACDHKRTQQRPREFQCGRNDGTGLRSCQSWTERDGTTYGAVCSKCGARRIDRQIGLEATPDEYLTSMVAVFREVRRILRPDGVCWVNCGDSYNNFRSQMGPGQGVHGRDDLRGKIAPTEGRRGSAGYKEKDLMMMPARLALALQADGWWLRSMLPWLKRSAMPENVTDRPASAVEYVFLLVKGQWTSRVIKFADLPGERVHLLHNFGLQPTVSPGPLAPSRHDKPSAIKHCVSLAAAIFDRAQREKKFSLPPFYSEEWQKTSGDVDSDFVRAMPVIHRPAVHAARFLASQTTAKEFVAELNSLQIALPDGDDFLVGRCLPEFGNAPTVYRNRERAVAVHDAGEICEFDFLHNQVITKKPGKCNYFFDAEAVKRGANGHQGGVEATPKDTTPGSGIKGNDSFRAAIREPVSARNMRNSDLFYDSLLRHPWEDEPEPGPRVRSSGNLERKLRGEHGGTSDNHRGFGFPWTGSADPAVAGEALGLICDTAGAPLALDVNPQAFTGSHFAVFPEKLVEPLIRAGTSERGCCGACGTPWVRITERRDTGRTQKMADGWDTGEGAHGTVHRNGREAGAAGVPVMSSITTGWAPSCTHDAAVVPCTVLDCFSGAGTVALVCDRLQRDAIGIELSAPYTAMATARVADDAPLFAWADAQP